MKFVVGIDGSETAAVAAARAGELALQPGGSVHVVCAYSGRDATTIQVGSDSFTVSSLTTAEQIAEQQAAAYRARASRPPRPPSTTSRRRADRRGRADSTPTSSSSATAACRA